MSLRETRPEAREVPLTSILPPELPARSQMDETKLDELTANIARNGVIQRLIVVPVDGRYEVVAGHRRLLAATRAGLVVVPVDVYPSKDAALEAVKYAENRFREDMSAAEEAVYFAELLQRECENDIEKLAALVGEKVTYVDRRLQLFNGDRDVFDALMQRKINIGVALELNKIPAEDYRRYYLGHAIKSGATVTVVSGWVAEWKNMYERSLPPPASSVPAPEVTIVSTYDPHRCYLCGESDPRYIPEQLSVHTHCRLAILDKMLRALHGEAATTE